MEPDLHAADATDAASRADSRAGRGLTAGVAQPTAGL